MGINKIKSPGGAIPGASGNRPADPYEYGKPKNQFSQEVSRQQQVLHNPNKPVGQKRAPARLGSDSLADLPANLQDDLDKTFGSLVHKDRAETLYAALQKDDPKLAKEITQAGMKLIDALMMKA